MIQNKADTVKKISDASGLALESIYRSIPSLEQLQLVEREFTTPSKYKALEPTQAFKLLKERDNQRRSELYKKTDSLLEKFAANRPTNQFNGDSDTVLITGYDALTRKLGVALQEMRHTFYGITDANNFRLGITNNGDFYERALKRGVKCYHVIELANNLDSLLLGDSHLIKTQSWQRKFVKGNSEEFAIIDGKHLFMSLTVPQGGKKHRAIHTTNPCLLAMAMNNFDTFWMNAKETPELAMNSENPKPHILEDNVIDAQVAQNWSKTRQATYAK